MSRRYNWPFNGNRYIGNSNTSEVHDLDKEKENCQINEIKTEHVVTFNPDTVQEALRLGHNGCFWCLPEYHTD